MGDRKSRFSVYVPGPEARLNMGQPIHKQEDADSFGYTGISLQAEHHLFIDIMKQTLVQGWGTSMWQMAGKVLQYSGGDTVIASGASSTLAASARMVVTAGAGQGSSHALSQGMPHMAPRMNQYNRLSLHYQVEGVHNGLKQLFYGEGWKDAQEKPQSAQLNEVQSGYASEGLLEKLRLRMEEVGHSPGVIQTALQPLEWEGNRIEMRNGPAGGPASVYPDVAGFDPYPAASARSPMSAAAIFGRYLQTVNFFHRFVDVLQRIGPAITDNFIGKRAQTLISAWENACMILPASLRVADIARWNREDGTHSHAWNDETVPMLSRHEAADFTSKATLTSKSEPYPLHEWPADQLTILVLDVNGGTPTPLTLTSSPAQPIPIQFADGYEAIAVQELEGAQVDLAVGVAVFEGGAWKDVPEAFQVDAGVFSRKDGALFSWVPSAATPAVPRASGSVELMVDGVACAVSLERLGVLPPADRAAELARQVPQFVDGKLTSRLMGQESTLKVPASKWFGTSDDEETQGPEWGTAEWLAAQLNGLGMNFDAEVKDGTCVVTHRTSGDASYLEITGGPTALLFGAKVASDQGSDPTWLDNHATLAALQVEVSSYPLDIQNTLRPVVQAFSDVMAVYDAIASLADNALDLAGLALGPAATLGLFGQEGITLGSGGKLFSMSDGITLVSAPSGEPDARKFAMGPVEKWLSVIADWDPLQEYWKKRDQGHPFQVDKKPEHEKSGVRVVSSTDFMVMAADEVRVMALGRASIEGERVELIANQSGLFLGARASQVQVQGKYLAFGLEGSAALGKQEATESIKLVSTQKLELKTAKAAQVIEDGVIQVGARGANAFEVDLSAPRLYVKAGAEVGIGTGDNSGAVAHGVLVDQQGDVVVTAKSKLTLQSGQGGLEVTSSGVTLNGQLKVGTELIIKGSGVFSPKALVKSQAALKTEQLQLKAKYTALMAKAQAAALALTALEAAWDALTGGMGTVIVPPIRLGMAKSAKKLKIRYGKALTELKALKDEREDLLAQGQLLDLDLAGMGGSPADAKVFS